MTKQDEVVLQHIAAKLCEHHEIATEGLEEGCGFCAKNYRIVQEVWDYGKEGRIPLSIAELLMSGRGREQY